MSHCGIYHFPLKLMGTCKIDVNYISEVGGVEMLMFPSPGTCAYMIKKHYQISINHIKPCLVLQSRSGGLLKQVQELNEQLEHTFVELTTFENLRQHEIGAIPKRMEVQSVFIQSFFSPFFSFQL